MSSGLLMPNIKNIDRVIGVAATRGIFRVRLFYLADQFMSRLLAIMGDI